MTVPGAAGQQDGIEQAYGLVSDTLAAAVRETIERHDPEPARDAVRRLTAIDDQVPVGDEPPPGWSLAFLVLADWFDVARTELADRPDRTDRALDWIEEHLGRRYRSRAGYTIAPLTSIEEARDTSHYVDALGTDFLASMVWAAAAVTDLYPDADGGRDWLRRRSDAAR
jgi:hypothetical protein